MNIQIVVFNGFEELDAIGPYEVWCLASNLKPEIKVKLVTLPGISEVTTSSGLVVRSRGTLGEEGPRLVIVPGGGWLNRAAAGAWTETLEGTLPARLSELHREGVLIASVCTGAMLLSSAGLLKNRPATTNRGAVTELRAAGAHAIAARVVDDGDVVTAGGIACGLDLALWLVERLFGAELAHAVEGELEYERRGTVWKRDSGSAAAPNVAPHRSDETTKGYKISGGARAK